MKQSPGSQPLQQPGWLGSGLDGVFRVPVRRVRPEESIRAAGVGGGSGFFCVSYVSALIRRIVEVPALPHHDFSVG